MADYKIIVNSQKVTVKRKRISYLNKLSYEEVIELSGQVPRPGYTVTFYKGRNGQSGTLMEGESISLTDGMIFNATMTGKS